MKKIFSFIFKIGIKLFSKTRIGEIYPVVFVYRHLHKYLKSDFSLVQGHKMLLDEKDSLRLSIMGVYEPFQTELVEKYIKKGDVVLDIGANIGYYTLLFAKLVGEKGKVFSFEPDPKNFSILKKNVKLNNYNNVSAICSAVSDKKEKLVLYLSSENKAHHTIFNSGDSSNYLEIDSVSLDEYFKNFTRNINFIKIDVEGAEHKVLKGMNSLLSKNKNVRIITEFSPGWLMKCGIEPKKYLEELNSLGFKFWDIDEKKKNILFITKEELLKKYHPNRRIHTNILCIKEEK